MAALVHLRNGHRLPASPMRWDPRPLIEHPLHLDGGVRIDETNEAVSVTIDMPGIDADDIDITLDGGTLDVVGRRGERTYAVCTTVGNAIDPDRISTKLEHGVLSIYAPKRASAHPRRISVNTKRSGAEKPARSWWRRWFGTK